MTTAPVRGGRAGPRPVSELADRVEAGRTARRARLVRRLGRALLLLAPVLLLGWVLMASSWLAVDRVQVVGQSRVSADEVQRAVAVAVGTPLARVDTGAAERRVAALPAVAAARVSRSWPGTLRVEVTERTAVAGVVSTDGVALVDAEGVLFATEPALPPGVVALAVPAPGPGDPATAAALRVHADLPPELRQRVRVVEAESPSAVELVLSGGARVVWGAPGGTATKAAAALVLLRPSSADGTDSADRKQSTGSKKSKESTESTDTTVIDVSAPGVVVRRGGPSPSPSPDG